MAMIIISLEAFGALYIFLLIFGGAIRKKREEKAVADALEAEGALLEAKEAKRLDLLERLSKAYKKAKGRGVHNFYLAALSHCCQLLQRGEEINEGAAMLALRGLEGDESLDARVNEILADRCKNEGDGE